MDNFELMRRKRNGKAHNFYQDIINESQQKTLEDEKVVDSIRLSRHHNIKVIDENKKRLNESIVKTKAEVKRKMEMGKAPIVEKNIREVQNTTFDSLISGFLDSVNKKKYIKINKENFKNLDAVQQRTLFKLYISYL